MSMFLKNEAKISSILCNKYKPSRPILNSIFQRNISDSSSDNVNNKLLENLESLDVEVDELKIEKLMNKSRLSPECHNILFDVKPYSVPMRKHHQTVKYNRRMYGIYGSESGVNPGIMWPTKEDIQERKEYEKVAFPFTIQEMVSAAIKEKDMKELEIQKRQEEIITKLSKLESWKKEIKEKIAKKEAEALAAKEKKDKLIEEVRRHFGYKVDPRDEKFQEMMAQKQKELSKAERQKRLEEREKKAIARLMEKQESK